MSSKSKIIFLLLVIILMVSGVLLINYARNDYGYATMSFQLPNTQGLDATINNQSLHVTGLNGTYKLHSGVKDLVVTKSNYKQFSVNFTIVRGQTLFITVAMQSTAPQVASVATSQVQQSLTSLLPQGFSVQQATYFYENTWVVATVEAKGGDAAVIVGKYVGGSKPWEAVLGPTDIFSPSDLDNLPSSVVQYMNQQGYVLQETPVQ